MKYSGVLPRDKPVKARLRMEASSMDKAKGSGCPQKATLESLDEGCDTLEFNKIRQQWTTFFTDKSNSSAIDEDKPRMTMKSGANMMSGEKSAASCNVKVLESMDCSSEQTERQKQELQYVMSHMAELEEKKNSLVMNAKKTQEELFRVDWEHKMGETTMKWYEMRLEVTKATEAVKAAEKELNKQKESLQMAQEQWQNANQGLQEATKLAQAMSEKEPDFQAAVELWFKKQEQLS